MIKGNLLKVCGHTLRPSSRKANTGDLENPIGMRTGSVWNILKSTDHLRKLHQILELPMPQLFSGSVNTTYPEEPSKNPGQSKSGEPQREIKTPCMVERGRKALAGKADVLQNGSRFTHHPNGRQSFPKCGNAIISAVKCVVSLATGYISTISNRSQIRKNEPISITLFSSVKSATALSIVKEISGGSF
jgi:hypothetical protein